MIGRPVMFSDPWQSLVVPSAEQGAVAELGASYAIAIGLALGGIEAVKKKPEPGSFGTKMKKLLAFKIG
jgi:hypothetical protein